MSLLYHGLKVQIEEQLAVAKRLCQTDQGKELELAQATGRGIAALSYPYRSKDFDTALIALSFCRDVTDLASLEQLVQAALAALDRAEAGQYPSPQS
jgi:hypothetical protein